jgi:hypothetical protein
MRMRTATFLAAALVVTGSEWVLWQALRDATNGLHHMARVYDRYEYVPGRPLVQPPPMGDPAQARNPITLGEPQ